MSDPAQPPDRPAVPVAEVPATSGALRRRHRITETSWHIALPPGPNEPGPAAAQPPVAAPAPAASLAPPERLLSRVTQTLRRMKPSHAAVTIAMLAAIAAAAAHTVLPLTCFEALDAQPHRFSFRYMRTEVTVLSGDVLCPLGTQPAGPCAVDSQSAVAPLRAPALAWPTAITQSGSYAMIVSVPARAPDPDVEPTVGSTVLLSAPAPADCPAANTPGATAWDCVIRPAVLGQAQRIGITPGAGKLANSPGLRVAFALPMYEPADVSLTAARRQVDLPVERYAHLHERVTVGLMDAFSQAAREGVRSVVMPLLGTGRHLNLDPYASIDASLDAVVRHAERRKQPTVDRVLIVAWHRDKDPSKATKAIERVRQRAARLQADYGDQDYMPERKLAWLILALLVVGIAQLPRFARSNKDIEAGLRPPGDRWYTFVAWLLVYGGVLNVFNDLLDSLFVAEFWTKVITLGLVALSPFLCFDVLRGMPRVPSSGEPPLDGPEEARCRPAREPL